MITQVMGVNGIETERFEVLNKAVQLKSAKIMGIENVRQITDREWRRDRRVRRLRRKRRQKCLTIGFALAVIFCVILICTVSYSSIKAQANTGFKYYTSVTVEHGETLWSIADRYIDYDHYEDKNAYIAEVESMNHLDAGETLLAGRLLIVPYYSAEYIQ